MSRHDILLLICLVLAVGLILVFQGIIGGSITKAELIVYITSPEPSNLQHLSLSELEAIGEEQQWQVEGLEGPLWLHFIPGQGIGIMDAPCSDQICVRSGYINKAGQAIVCVPGQVMLKIQSNKKQHEKGDVDAILQ